MPWVWNCCHCCFFCISWGEETENKQLLLVVHISFTGWWQFNCCGYHVGGHRINSRCCIVRFIEISKRCCMVWTMQSYRSRLWHQRSRSCRIQEILQLNAIMHMRKVCYELLKFGTHTHTHSIALFTRGVEEVWHAFTRYSLDKSFQMTSFLLRLFTNTFTL